MKVRPPLAATAAAVLALPLAVAISAPQAAAQVPGGNGRLAVLRSETPGQLAGLYTLNPDGSDEQLLWSMTTGASAREVSWSPDGSTLAVAYYDEVAFPPPGSRQIWLVDADGSDRRRITSGSGSANDASWSPDGTKLAYYTSADDIFVLPADGSGTPQLVYDGTCVDDIAWAASGPLVYYIDCGTHEVHAVSSEGGAPVQITSTPVVEREIDLSPDGSTLAVTSVAPSGAGVDLRLVRLDGSADDVLLTRPGLNGPAFSPDGTQMALSTVPHPASQWGTELLDLTTGVATQVSTGRAVGQGETDVAWQRAAATPPPPPPAPTYTYAFAPGASMTTYTPTSSAPLNQLAQYPLSGTYTIRPEPSSPYFGSTLFTITAVSLTSDGGPSFALPAGATGQLVCFSGGNGCEFTASLAATGFHAGATATIRGTGIAPFGPLPSGDPLAPSGFDWTRSGNSFTAGGYGLYTTDGGSLQIAAAVRGSATLPPPPPPPDTVAPTITFASPAADQNVPYGGSVTLDWSCADDRAVRDCTAVTKLGGVDGAHGETVVTPGTVVDSTVAQAGPYALIVTARDASGNTTTAVRSYYITPISVTPRLLSPAPGATQPFRGDVTVGFACGDPAYPIDSCTATHDGVAVANGDVVSDLTSGWHVIRVSAVHDPDGATRSATTIYRYPVLNRNGFHPGACCALDATAPTISLDPPDGTEVSAGAELTAQFSCSDSSSMFRCIAELLRDGGAPTPVASGGQLDTGEPGGYTLTVTAEDSPGNISTRSVRYTVTSPGDVTAEVTGGETVTTGASATVEVPVQTSIVVPTGISGTVSVDSQPSGAPPAGFTLFGQQLVIEGPAATAASPYQLSFRVDQSALAGLAPADVQVWRNGVAVGGCTDPDAAVPDPCIAFRGFTPEAGDGGDALVTVRTSRFSTWTLGAVDYDLVGPYAPVDALPVVNTTRAGSAVPVKFRVGGDRGLDIFSAGYPKVVATNSCTGGTDEVEQTVNVGASALTYDAASGTYTYKWKTAKTDTGCKELVLRMKDGSELRARFNLR